MTKLAQCLKMMKYLGKDQESFDNRHFHGGPINIKKEDARHSYTLILHQDGRFVYDGYHPSGYQTSIERQIQPTARNIDFMFDKLKLQVLKKAEQKVIQCLINNQLKSHQLEFLIK